MADEFIKGLSLFTVAGLAWMVLAGWYRTSSFESTQQLVEPVIIDTGSASIFNVLGVALMDVFFWLALLGPLAFWVLIPAGRQTRKAIENRRNA